MYTNSVTDRTPPGKLNWTPAQHDPKSPSDSAEPISLQEVNPVLDN